MGGAKSRRVDAEAEGEVGGSVIVAAEADEIGRRKVGHLQQRCARVEDGMLSDSWCDISRKGGRPCKVSAVVMTA
eukprot:scaffold5720_cov127-Isochrysis_galbana.AAC.8